MRPRRAPAWVLAALVAAVALAAEPAGAQGGGGQGPHRRVARMEQLLRRRVGLSDDQIVKLRATTRTFGPQRMALARQERALVDSLRDRIAAATRDERAVAALIERLFAVRRARLDLRQREQTALAEFLTPSQRAMLLGLEEQAQRRAAAMRAQRRGGRQ